MRTKLEKYSLWAAFAMAGVVIVLLYRRLFVGVDFTDEGYYCSLPVAFARGWRPYIDEIGFTEGGAMLLTPFAALYIAIVHSNNGVVLFLRHIYFISLLASGVFAVFVSCRRLLGHKPLAILMILIYITFWPYTIPNLSYNTMGSLFFMLGFLTLLNLANQKRVNWQLPLAILFFTFAIISYPTIGVPAAVSGAIFLIVSRKYNWSKWIFALCCAEILLIVGGVLLFFIFVVGKERMDVTMQYTRSYGGQGGGARKALMVLNQLKANWTFIALIIAGFWAQLLINWSKAAVRWAIAVGWIAALFWYPLYTVTIASFHLTLTAISILALPAMVGKIKQGDRDFWTYVPALGCLTGATYAWTSSNGVGNYPIGTGIGMIGLGFYLEDFLNKQSATTRLTLTAMIAALAIFQVQGIYGSVYGDDSPATFSFAKTATGPYQGLRTSPFKMEIMNNLVSDIKEAESLGPKRGTIAFYDMFEAAYLFTELKPSAFTTNTNSLLFMPYDRDMLTNYYNDSSRLPAVLVWFKFIPVNPGFSFDLTYNGVDSLKSRLMPLYTLTHSRRDYSVYALRK